MEEILKSGVFEIALINIYIYLLFYGEIFAKKYGY